MRICVLRLSNLAIQDLRVTLRKIYGDTFDTNLTDDEINQIGVLLLSLYMTGLKKSTKNKTAT
jgi:hypothetical protein